MPKTNLWNCYEYTRKNSGTHGTLKNRAGTLEEGSSGRRRPCRPGSLKYSVPSLKRRGRPNFVHDLRSWWANFWELENPGRRGLRPNRSNVAPPLKSCTGPFSFHHSKRFEFKWSTTWLVEFASPWSSVQSMAKSILLYSRLSHDETIKGRY